MKKHTSLRGLRTFCVAARHESFRDAAERMHVTSSAVSHQVKNLEDEVGQPLFERGARQLRLTAVGRSLYEDIGPLIERIDDRLADCASRPKRQQLRVSVQPFFASEMFVPRLSEFTAAHPDIDIQVETSDEGVEKFAASADASIRIFRSPPDGLEAHRLFPLRLIPAGSPRFLRQMKVRDGRIASDFPLIVHDGRSRAWQDWADIAGVVLPEDAKSIRLASMIAVARAAEKGIGAALIPVELSHNWFRDENLVPLFDTPLTTDDAYYFVCSPENARLAHVQLLKGWVLETFRRKR